MRVRAPSGTILIMSPLNKETIAEKAEKALRLNSNPGDSEYNLMIIQSAIEEAMIEVREDYAKALNAVIHSPRAEQPQASSNPYYEAHNDAQPAPHRERSDNYK